MIIVSNKNIKSIVYFPQNIYTKNNDIYKLVLFDRGTNKKYEYPNLEDKHLVQYDYYTFEIRFCYPPSEEVKNWPLPDGEYEYTIFDSNNDIVGKGLIRLNELKQDNIYYNKNNEFIAYDKQ